MRIIGIDIQNFRKLFGCHIDISKETTLFVGANNSGKTSAMDALAKFLANRSFVFNDITIPKHTVLAKRNLLCSTFAGNHANYKKECRKDTGGNGLIRLAGAFPQKTRTYRLLSFFLPLFPAPNRVSEIPQTTH